MKSTTPRISTELLEGSATEQIGARLARELRHRWHRGERVSAEEFLAANPDLCNSPEIAVDLIYEEYCLRQAAGDEGAEQDILNRFPQWEPALRVMLDCHQHLVLSEQSEPKFPAAGQTLGEFEIVSELARGSRGRVYLATQRALAGRPVVLKVTPLDGHEHDSLARLQHTNIVPLYSVNDERSLGIRVLCMPYFGRTTLESLLTVLRDVPLSERSGCRILDAIDRDRVGETPKVNSAARQLFENVSYVQAVCFIGACIADALQFAHERGLVHLDLKPSNVLLGIDGQPMLLDFHLAHEPIAEGSRPENLGGTPPYMAPEQQLAMVAIKGGQPVTRGVDRRADIFALGVILYEALAAHPLTHDANTPLHASGPTVSAGLSDIIVKCNEVDPDRRYHDAKSLAEDLRRHLADQPLLGVPNRNWAERWRKWRRRRPAALRLWSLVSVILLTVIGAAWIANAHVQGQAKEAQLALLEGERQMRDKVQLSEAVQTFERGLGLTRHLFFHSDLQTKLHDRLNLAKQLRLVEQLHHLGDDLRAFYGTKLPERRLRSLADSALSLWNQRDAILTSVNGDPQLNSDLQEVAFFAASAQFQLARASGDDAQRATALRICDEVQQTFGRTELLDIERQMLTNSRHLLSSPANESATGSVARPRTASEHCSLARGLLEMNNFVRASAELTEARKIDPSGLWPNFYSGICAHALGRYHDAIADFSVCIGARPGVSVFFYDRALSYAKLNQLDAALQDLNHAIELDGKNIDALLTRSALLAAAHHNDAARADLLSALQQGADPAIIQHRLALLGSPKETPR